MPITEMYLPIDIPWKRCGVSSDMIDQTGGDVHFPEKWRSSIAVFYHEPPDLPPEYCKRKITYLKIVCTITNYQLPYGQFQLWKNDKSISLGNNEIEDMTALDEVREPLLDWFPYEEFERRITSSFPCYGALLQVGVYPNPADGVELHDFPYISSFQPRKREMYETISQSGEILSQSSSGMNVQKGHTNTETAEDYDITTSNRQNHGLSLGILGDWGLRRSTGQWGTIGRNENVEQHVTSLDASREKREAYSYSTNINQLYSLLQGYHLGTNRALFFLQPRPHIQDTKFTFIRGKRRLEGIQEFFLIVNRPDTVPGICVEIALETAHTYLTRKYQPRVITSSDFFTAPENLEKTAEALGIPLNEQPYLLYHQRVLDWNNLNPSLRMTVHRWLREGQEPGYVLNALDGDVEAWNRIVWIAAHIPEYTIEDVALIFEDYEADSGNIFITGRRLCTCVTPVTVGDNDETNGNDETGDTDNGSGEIGPTLASPNDIYADTEKSNADHISTCGDETWIVYETPYRGPNVGKSEYIPWENIEASQSAFKQNQFIKNINDTLASSLGSPNRVPYGKTSLMSTDFILDELTQMIRLLSKVGLEDRPIEQINGISKYIERGLGKLSKCNSIHKLGFTSSEHIQRDLDVTRPEAKIAFREILVAALRSIDVERIDLKAYKDNLIVERFHNQFPNDSFEKVLHSAGITTKPNRIK